MCMCVRARVNEWGMEEGLGNRRIPQQTKAFLIRQTLKVAALNSYFNGPKRNLATRNATFEVGER
jgi:hypothetical protein